MFLACFACGTIFDLKIVQHGTTMYQYHKFTWDRSQLETFRATTWLRAGGLRSKERLLQVDSPVLTQAQKFLKTVGWKALATAKMIGRSKLPSWFSEVEACQMPGSYCLKGVCNPFGSVPDGMQLQLHLANVHNRHNRFNTSTDWRSTPSPKTNLSSEL